MNHKAVTKMQKSANDIFIACPNFEAHGGEVESTPSCSVHKETGTAHCFGCDYSDSFPGLIARLLELPDRLQGYRWLLSNYSIPSKDQRELIKLKEYPRTHIDFILPESALDVYRLDHPYMYKRGFTENIIDLFDLGFDKQTKAITIPMRDAKGQLRFIKKRPIGATKFHKYHIDEGVDKREIIFGLDLIKQNIKKVKMIYICEGEMDVMSMYQSRKYGAGTQGDRLFPEQVKQLIRIAKGVPICLCYDNDKAGRGARERAIPMLSPYFPLYEPMYPRSLNPDRPYKDPNDLLRAGLLDFLETKPIRP